MDDILFSYNLFCSTYHNPSYMKWMCWFAFQSWAGISQFSSRLQELPCEMLGGAGKGQLCICLVATFNCLQSLQIIYHNIKLYYIIIFYSEKRRGWERTVVHLSRCNVSLLPANFPEIHSLLFLDTRHTQNQRQTHTLHNHSTRCHCEI